MTDRSNNPLEENVIDPRFGGDARAPDHHILEVVFRDSPAAMALWRGTDLVFEMVNPRYQAIFPERELLGRSLLEAIPELEGQGFGELLLNVLETGEPYIGREVLARLAPYDDGPLVDHYFDFTYVRIDDVDGNPWGVYDHAIDVTDRVMTRRKNEELWTENQRLLEVERTDRESAEEQNRMKDGFLATVSHELRTPLSAILGWSQLLRQQGIEPEELVEGLESIEKNARMQTMLIDDLLDMSRIIAGGLRLNISMQRCSMFIQSSIESVMPAASAKRIRIETTIDCDDEVAVDPHRMQQVMWNLLSNAIKFTPSGGRIHVTTRREGPSIEIVVTDQGEGIATELLPHIFDRFRQGEKGGSGQKGGLGLGLAIARQIVELHGGTIEAASAGEGNGARFTVTMPVPDPDTTSS